MSGQDLPAHGSQVSLPPPNGNLVAKPHETDGQKQEWQCPYCDHSLRYRPENSEIAELAVLSHMQRRHRDSCDR